MKAILDAVFEDGVFKPAQSPSLAEGQQVRITVESLERNTPEDVLELASRVYAGLGAKDIDEIEEAARKRDLFAAPHE